MKTECSAAELVAFKARFRESFSYDPETGILLWTERPRNHFKRALEWKRHNNKYAGKEAGTVTYRPNGRRSYDVVSFRLGDIKKRFYIHQVIFVLMGVDIPDGFAVDHKDLNIWNNRWSNLRLATHQQNSQNRVLKRPKHNLPKGAYITPAGKYIARIWKDGRNFSIGTFATPEEAHAAYCAEASRLHGQFFRGR